MSDSDTFARRQELITIQQQAASTELEYWELRLARLKAQDVALADLLERLAFWVPPDIRAEASARAKELRDGK